MSSSRPVEQERTTYLYNELLLRWLDRINSAMRSMDSPGRATIQMIEAILACYSLLPAELRREIDVEYYNKYYVLILKEREKRREKSKEKSRFNSSLLPSEKEPQEKTEGIPKEFENPQSSIPTLHEMLHYEVVVLYGEPLVLREEVYKDVLEGEESGDLSDEELKEIAFRESIILRNRAKRAASVLIDVLNRHGLLLWSRNIFFEEAV